MTDSESKEPKRPSSSDLDEATDNGEQSPWLVAGVFGALGFEFVGFILGGYIVGAFIDDRFGTAPWGVMTMVLLGLVAVLWHTYRVAKRFLE
jgi:F0F1-type ATP synthase assembly protein I